MAPVPGWCREGAMIDTDKPLLLPRRHAMRGEESENDLFAEAGRAN